MTEFFKWWQRNFLTVELAVVFVVTAAIIAWAECIHGVLIIEYYLGDSRTEVYGTFASIFAALLGFSMTAVSIVIGFTQTNRFRILRESQQFPTLGKVFIAAIRALGFATVVSLLGLVADREMASFYQIGYVVFFSFLLVCVRIARVAWVLENVVRLMARPTLNGND